MKQSPISVILGFAILFAVYHFPEFFKAFWIAAVFKIGFLLVAYFVARAQRLRNLGGFGLNFHEGWWGNLLKGLLFGLAFYIIFVILSIILDYERIAAPVSFVELAKKLPLILLMTLFPSVAEDILTRGYLFAFLKRKVGSRGFVLISASVYVLNHIWRYKDGAAVLCYLFILGLALAYAVWYTRSLWLAFGIHWATNIVYESTAPLLKTDTLSGSTGHWLLAGTYFLLLCFLLLTTRLARYSKHRSYR